MSEEIPKRLSCVIVLVIVMVVKLVGKSQRYVFLLASVCKRDEREQSSYVIEHKEIGSYSSREIILDACLSCPDEVCHGERLSLAVQTYWWRCNHRPRV